MRVRGGLKCRNEKSLCGVTPNLVTCHRLLATLVSWVTFVDCARVADKPAVAVNRGRRLAA